MINLEKFNIKKGTSKQGKEYQVLQIVVKDSKGIEFEKELFLEKNEQQLLNVMDLKK